MGLVVRLCSSTRFRFLHLLVAVVVQRAEELVVRQAVLPVVDLFALPPTWARLKVEIHGLVDHLLYLGAIGRRQFLQRHQTGTSAEGNVVGCCPFGVHLGEQRHLVLSSSENLVERLLVGLGFIFILVVVDFQEGSLRTGSF